MIITTFKGCLIDLLDKEVKNMNNLQKEIKKKPNLNQELEL